MDELSFAEFPETSREVWRAAVDKVLKGADFDKRLVSRLEDGLRVQPLYGADETLDSGTPGSFPFVRGTQAAGVRWRVEQRQAHPDPATANAQALDDLQRGADGLRLAIADPVAAEPTGICLADPADLAPVLDGVFTDMAAVSLDAGSRAPAFGKALLDLWQSRGHASTASGDLHIDPLATLAHHGRLDRELAQSFAEAAAVATAAAGVPGARALGVDLRPVHDAGAGPSLELAVGLAHAVAMLRGLEVAGLAPDAAAAQVTWLVPVDADLFTGIAKIRALRRCWSTVLATFGSEAAPRITAETSRRMLTRRDPYVNLLRNTVATFAGGTGGADTLTVLPFTAALGLPDGTARRMARNIQLVLLDEAHLSHVADPGGGSWYIENLTDQLAGLAWRTFQEIEGGGGFVETLRSGALHERIDAQWQTRSKGLATRREMLTGVSAFPLIDEHPVELDPFDASDLVGRIKALAGADAVTCTPLPVRRPAAAYETLRDRADAHGAGAKVLLLQLGTLAESNVRSTWIKNLVEAGGLRAVESGPVADGDAVAQAVAESGCGYVVLCSTDGRYAELADSAAAAAKGAGASTVALAGRPGDREPTYRAAGIEVFLYQGVDVLAALEDAHNRLGIAA